LTYNNPPSDVESDCIGEVQAPSNVEEDHMHAAYGGTNLVGSKFRFVGEDVTTGEEAGTTFGPAECGASILPTTKT
jgi:hypothetical protein